MKLGLQTGEAFIAYIILMTVVGLPLYVLELSLGQFGQSGIVQLWRAVPFFKGEVYIFISTSILLSEYFCAYFSTN